MKQRMNLLWKMTRKVGVDAIIITSHEMIRYLTGFTGSESILVLSGKKVFIIVDSRYTEQAQKECRGVVITEHVKKIEGVSQTLSEMGCKKIGFDPDKLTVSQQKVLKKGLSGELVELPSEVHTLRSKKDDAELTLMMKSATISSNAFLEVLKDMRTGKTEKEIALRLEYLIREKGAEAVPFPIIVASGVRGALPHGRASNKKLEKGDFITVDFGSVYQGYCSDETCTVVLGKPRPKQKKIYEVVKNAHDEAVSRVKEGIKAKEIDRAARRVVERAGLGKYFRHGTGHGVGLAVHEEPRIAPEQEMQMERNMVFTIEPGVYIPGWGGVRIEDMVRVTRGGCEVMSSVTKELLCV